MSSSGPGHPLTFNLVTTFYPPYNFGGDGIFVYRLANALAGRGHRVNVVHCADSYAYLARRPPRGEFPNHPGVTVHTLRSRFGRLSPIATYGIGLPALKASALEAILNRPADVTHFHNVSLVGGPGVLSYGRGVKLYTAHEHWLVCPTHILWKFDREPCEKKECFRCTIESGRPPQFWRYTPLLRRQLKHLDALIVSSRFSLERHAELGIRTELLPNFVPEPTPSTGGPPPHPRPYVVYAGRLEKPKGILWLVDVFRGYRGVDLLVAGDGMDEPTARAAAAELPHVRFLGRLDRARLDELFRHAVGVVVPSLCYETFGMVVVEALAVGSPVLVRDLGPLPELVEQSRAGFTFRESHDLVAGIERLRADPALRKTLGQRGLEAYRERWTAERHLRRYFDLIAGLGGSGRVPAVPLDSAFPGQRA
ncbi:MAG: glycosyltransferase family 4 protein [Chloroflexota bacterium]|nr:glycosyltransferase family 4 protein [Chloroflexota bacterium]